MTPATERPVIPAAAAPASEWASYYEAMAIVYRQIATQQTTLTEHERRLDWQEREIIALSEDMVSVKEALAIMGEMPEPRISIHQQN